MTLGDLLASCNLLLDYDIPVNDLRDHCAHRNDRGSLLATAEIVSDQNTSAGGRKPLHKFKYKDLSPETRPDFLSFGFDDTILEAKVKSKLLFLDFDIVLQDLTSQLTQLRSIIYSIKKLEGLSPTAVWNELKVQCMMMLFLNYTFAACGSVVRAKAANNLPIQLIDGFVTWEGMADLTCSNVEEVTIEEATATLEIKVPFNQSSSTLYKSKALQPKQQLLGQAMGLRQLKPSRLYNLSYLTDIFALSVMYHVNGRAYLSTRVSDAKAVCLRLLLMCCNLTCDEWELLISTELTPVDIEDDDDTVSLASGNPNTSNPLAHQSHASVRPVTRSQTNYDGEHRKRGKVSGTFGDEEEEAHEQWQKEIADVLRWESKCLGYSYLGIEEMRGHNVSV